MTRAYTTEHILATSFAISTEMRSVCEQYYLTHYPNVKYVELKAALEGLHPGATFIFHQGRRKIPLKAVPFLPKMASQTKATKAEMEAATTLISVRKHCGKVYILVAPAFSFTSRGSIREDILSLQEMLDIHFPQKLEAKQAV